MRQGAARASSSPFQCCPLVAARPTRGDPCLTAYHGYRATSAPQRLEAREEYLHTTRKGLPEQTATRTPDVHLGSRSNGHSLAPYIAAPAPAHRSRPILSLSCARQEDNRVLEQRPQLVQANNARLRHAMFRAGHALVAVEPDRADARALRPGNIAFETIAHHHGCRRCHPEQR